MKKYIFIVLSTLIVLSIAGCTSKVYILDQSYDNKIISDSTNPYDSELVNGLCSFDLTDSGVILERETNPDNLMFEEIEKSYFTNTDDKIFHLRLTCGEEKTIFYYAIDGDDDGLLAELFMAETINETYAKYDNQMDFLYDLELIQNYNHSKLSTIFYQLEIDPTHNRLMFFKDMVRGIGYSCHIEEVGISCSRRVYSALGRSGPNQNTVYEIITIEVLFGESLRNAEVSYYKYNGCYEFAESCSTTPIESTTTFLYQNWMEYIDISRDPRDERADSRDFLNNLSSIIGDYTQIN